MAEKKTRSFNKLGRMVRVARLRVVVLVVLLVMLLVMLAPTLLSGYVGGVIEREVGSRVNGSVSVGDVSLGWSGPQKVSALSIDGGAEVGSMRIDAEIAQGLWALATGDTVDVRVSGDVRSSLGADGSLGLRRLAQADTTTEPPTEPPTETGQVPPTPTSLLGGRRLRVELTGIDLRATAADGRVTALEGLKGTVTATEDAALTLAIDSNLSATTRMIHAGTERNGGVATSIEASLPRATDGGFVWTRAEADLSLGANDFPLPGPVEAIAESLSIVLEAADGGAKLKLNAALRVDAALGASDAPASRIEASVDTGRLVDAEGNFDVDPARIRVMVDARSVPLAVFQPYVPEIARGVKIDLAKDVGDVADIVISKDDAARADMGAADAKSASKATLRFDARKLKVSLETDVATNASGEPIGLEHGTLAASASVRPELLRALGVETETPLVATAMANELAWRRGDTSAVSSLSVPTSDRPLRAVGGTFEVKLARTFEWKGMAPKTSAEESSFFVPVRVEVFGLTIDKPMGEDAARCAGVVEGRYADAGTLKADFSGRFDPAERTLGRGTCDVLLGLDPSLVEQLSNGAVRIGSQTASLRIAATGLEISPRRDPIGVVHAELAGALAVSGGEATAVVNDLVADATLGGESRASSLTLAAKIDGAQARAQQSFGGIPMDFSDPAALGLSGSIELSGLDPAVISRMAPAAAERIGVLGRGPMRLSVRNKTEAGTLSADFDLAAAAVAARGAARVAKDSITLRDITCDGTLTREALASVGLDDSIELEPGARYALRVPAFAMARGDAGWAPSGDLAGSATVQGLSVRRAPGIKAPIAIARIAAEATYVLREDRAASKGAMTLGANGGDGTVAFDLTWRKPAEAKVFAGLEGKLDATGLDLARLEVPLGLEQGRLSSVLGGPGSLRVALSEREVAGAALTAEFPRMRAQIDATLPEMATGRVAQAKGSLRTEIAPGTFAHLAGFAQDAKRRVVSPVTVDLTIASLSLPIDVNWKPGLAGVAIDARGSISPVSIEVTDERGAKSTVSTDALSVTALATRASEEITLKIATAKGTTTTTAASTSAKVRGSLDADAKVRGLFAEAKPDGAAGPIAVDAVVAARAFPAATFDVLASTDGAIQRYLGDVIDADIDARIVGAGTPAARGTMKASLVSPNARVDVPEVAIADGFARVATSKPMTATLALSEPVREQLLAPIHQIFADVVSGAPARFTLANLAWPLDGDRRRFDAEFTLETGEVKLVNSGLLSWILMAAQAERADGFEAFIEPLRGRVAKGRLTYRDFALRAGKTTQAASAIGWKNSLVFSGDIDLASVPMKAIAITTGVPLSDAGNWSSDARRLFESIGAVSPELLKSLVVGVKLSGPIFDAQGRPAKLNESLQLPDIGEAIRQNPGGAIEAVGGIIDLFTKKDEKKNDGKQDGKRGGKKDGTKGDGKQDPKKDSDPGQSQPDAPKPQG